MASSDSCTLSILVARTDVPYMTQTIPHIVRSCRHPFVERVLIVDTAPLHKRYRSNPNIGTLEQLRKCCQQLVEQKVVDQAIDIDYSRESCKRLFTKNFGQIVKHTHDHRGYPILGILFALDRSVGRYLLHFDSDMLLHQAAGFDWVGKAVEVMDKHPEVMFCSPLPGPPQSAGQLQQGTARFELDPDGFYRFKQFTSRKFLVDKERLNKVLPRTPLYVPSRRRRWLSLLTGDSTLCGWEDMISVMLMGSEYVRADLASPEAWTLHTPNHGPEFLAKLPSVIERVEAGSFPPGQAGDYDLRLEKW
jgi:hypothetical protein